MGSDFILKFFETSRELAKTCVMNNVILFSLRKDFLFFQLFNKHMNHIYMMYERVFSKPFSLHVYLYSISIICSEYTISGWRFFQLGDMCFGSTRHEKSWSPFSFQEEVQLVILHSLEVSWMTSYGGSKRNFCEEKREQIYNKKQWTQSKPRGIDGLTKNYSCRISNTLLLRLNSILLYIFDKGVAATQSTESVYKEGYSYGLKTKDANE